MLVFVAVGVVVVVVAAVVAVVALVVVLLFSFRVTRCLGVLARY